MGTEVHIYGVQTFAKYGLYKVKGYLGKCTFETYAAIVQIVIRSY